jgi:hypothetical protein
MIAGTGLSPEVPGDRPTISNYQMLEKLGVGFLVEVTS